MAALVKAAHPGPCAAVTLVGTALAATAGAPAGTCVVLAAAVLAGQLSIGWANDAVDHRRDLAANRRDKPVARGALTPRAVWRAAALAAAACVPLSLALGAAAGVVHLVAVAGGWAYDLGLKRTVWSAVPFAVSFGLLPAVATLALPEPVTPPWWATAAGALLGVAAHLANALPDLDDDVSAGVLGLPQRLGPRRTRVAAGSALGAAAVVLTVGPGVPLGVAGAALLLTTAVLLAAAFGRRWPEPSRAPFALTMVAALTVVGLLLARGASLS
ncbi:MAG: UbiA family prenyltransferase [Actinomycetes bacterium]